MNADSRIIEPGGTMNAKSDTIETGNKRQLTDTDRFRLLANEQRRVALDVLTNASTPIELDMLATEIAVRQGDSNTVDARTIEHVTIALHHQHLPKMAELGVIEYDSNAKTVLDAEDLGHVIG